MNYFTATISPTLAEKLKEKGIHQLVDSRMEGWLNSGDNITYAEVFDYFLERDIRIHLLYVPKSNLQDELWRGIVGLDIFEGTWHEAAEKAIEYALTLI